MKISERDTRRKTLSFLVDRSSCYSVILFLFLLFVQLETEWVSAANGVRNCNKTHFGYECRFKCRCKENEICDEKTGFCPSGCADGYWGSNCQLSNDCYYNGIDKNYRGTKSITKRFITCKKWTNSPDNYCKPLGGIPPWCYTVGGSWGYCAINNCNCPTGLYGINCRKECHCRNATSVCEENSGYCTFCGPGWTGTNCNTECLSGTFGEDCKHICHCMNVSQCRKTDGKCLSGGCVAGYTGENCQKVCANGTFGPNCQQKCHCADISKCRKTDGKCLDNTCIAGYIGFDCQKICPNGSFGENCQGVCNCKTQSLCSHVDGYCVDRICKVGYKGPSCQQACSVGNFGENCRGVCNCKNKDLCSNIDGYCADKKCIFGYKGPSCHQRNVTLLSLIVVLPLFLLIIIITAIFAYKKKKKTSDTNSEDFKKSTEHISMSHIEQINLAYDENEKESIYENTGFLAQKDILSYIEKNNMEEEPFASEFSKLPQDLIHEHTAGMLKENVRKNRFKSLVPYDSTRVVLLPNELSTSDYINASYITEEKKYIATQGPIDGTTNDFWRMVWQEKSNTIIMLTDIVENGKLKCAQYWPDLNHTETYGKYKVHCVQEKKYMIYTYRLFSLTLSSYQSQEECFIDHFQCTTWPDHDVPQDPIYFIEFRNKIKHMKSVKPPYIVHCSAGIGRTGTYIALDILLEKLCHNNGLDVFQCVNELRHQRPLMVHRRKQYQFIYEVLAEDILTGFSEIPTECIPTEFRKMLTKNQQLISPLEEQYKRLLVPFNTEENEEIKENIYKNVENNNDADNELDDILHITFLDGFSMTNEIILTTQPQDELIEEFWKLVYHQRCNTIIMFEDLFNAVSAYWPYERESPEEYGSMTVELMGLTETETSFQRQFKISSSESTLGDVFVNHFQSKIWLNNGMPSQNEIIEFIQMIHGYIKPQRPILVHSQDNFDKSGLFIILNVMIQMLKNETFVSILRLVRRMKRRNSFIASNFRSYEYCWMIANIFIGELSIYSNF